MAEKVIRCSSGQRTLESAIFLARGADSNTEVTKDFHARFVPRIEERERTAPQGSA